MNREYETVRVEDRGEGLLLLTLNRPEVANAMNTQMGRDLLAFFDAVNAAPAQTRCIVLTGAGERAFCAGGDLKERNGMTDEAWQDQHLLFERMIRAFIGCPVPVIGAVNGAAYAGGCELALVLRLHLCRRDRALCVDRGHASASCPALAARRTCRARSASAVPRRSS